MEEEPGISCSSEITNNDVETKTVPRHSEVCIQLQPLLRIWWIGSNVLFKLMIYVTVGRFIQSTYNTFVYVVFGTHPELYMDLVRRGWYTTIQTILYTACAVVLRLNALDPD